MPNVYLDKFLALEGTGAQQMLFAICSPVKADRPDFSPLDSLTDAACSDLQSGAPATTYMQIRELPHSPL